MRVIVTLAGSAASSGATHSRVDVSGAVDAARPPLSLAIASRADLASCAVWRTTFADRAMDFRYYEIVEDTLRDRFAYRYFAVVDAAGGVRAVQPFFLLDQDLLEGLGSEWRAVSLIRRRYPGFLKFRTLMMGCAAGEAHLAVADGLSAALIADTLCRGIMRHARSLGARLVVLKEFPAADRAALGCFMQAGFARIPSMPMTILNIEYDSFEHYICTALSGNARRHLRRNLRATDGITDIRMSTSESLSDIVDDVYPLYLQVFERSKFRFEKLTREYFRAIGERMPDRVRFFTWRRNSTLIAFSLNMAESETLSLGYIGLDYAIALDLHLYHYIVRDIISWAIRHKYRWIRSSGLNYDPKLHLRHRLDPIDLYVRHTSPIVNPVLKCVLPWIAPARHDRTLAKFSNYAELW